MKKISMCLLVLLASVFTSACSVIMAANKSGVAATTLSQCKTRTCLITDGAQPISKKTDKKGKLISEEYKAQLPKGSAARAAMHAALDVSTLGIWEVAGTPIEAVQGEKKYYVVKVNYGPDGEQIKSFQLEN